MVDIMNANVEKMYDLNGVHQVVVQKGNIGGSYIYALQLLNKGTDTVVYRARKGATFKKGAHSQRVYLDGPKTSGINTKQTAGGHTQTWEYAGTTDRSSGKCLWFTGTKSRYNANDGIYWDTQIARITFGEHHRNNTEMTRISNLNQAGRKFGLDYNGNNLVRSEVAVSPSPNYNLFLVVTVDKAGTGYFSLYRLSDINTALNEVGTGDLNLKTNSVANQCLKAFKIDQLTTKVGSLQGYDIDDAGNIYISSEYHPDKVYPLQSKSRKIVKIQWDTTEINEWDIIHLDNNSILDESGYATEFEGIQVNGENDLYLTVAYHDSYEYTTKKNKIFRITW